jgi:gluconate 2-dehydrogenase gamma chain
MTFISRRDLLKRAGAVGVATAACGGSARVLESSEAVRSVEHFELQNRAKEPFENLTATQGDLLEAIVSRLIPSDANGPGASEARAAHYIDRALGGALSSSRQAYTSGLAAFDRYSRSSRGKPFIELSATDQDSVLVNVEAGAAEGFPERSSVFFALVLTHTHQGTFSDPYYGGNANFIGWDLIGYPGIRTMVSAADQEHLEKHDLRANHKSAYDYESFTRASARANTAREMTRGD